MHGDVGVLRGEPTYMLSTRSLVASLGVKRYNVNTPIAADDMENES